ncbi:MAG: methyltransferase domain-containing protein [Vicinamibacterales bacterium]
MQFAQMLQDRPRVEAYAESMRRSIRAGDLVVDIGCGTGYFSFLACQLGARKVYAIEPDEVIEVARESARASGLSDRIEFIRDLSTRVELPEKARVIISDLRGALPPHTLHLTSLIDARTRLLEPGGILICQRDTLSVALIEHAEGHDRCQHVWDSLAGVDQSACKAVAVNTREPVRFRKGIRLGPAQAWAVIDYCHNTEPHVSGGTRWKLAEPFRAHGLCLWFDAEYAGGVQYTSGPNHVGTPVYGRLFFPWPQEARLGPEEIVDVQLEARLIGQDYVWNWETRISTAAGIETSRFSQSSLLDRPLAAARLQRRSPRYTPELDDEGNATRFALSLMDGTRPQQAIAEQLKQGYPHRFATSSEALDFVTLLSLKFSK